MKKNVLVTATGGGGVGSGILHALIRGDAAVRERWNVIAADANPFSWGLYQTEHSLVLPLATALTYIDAMKQAVKTYELDAIIPGAEAEIPKLVRHREEFRPAVVVANREDLLPVMLDKSAAAARLRELGLPYVETLPAQAWRELVDRYDFPLVVKPSRMAGGSKGVHLVTNENEMRDLLLLLDPRTAPCVQPYVGSADEEYTVGVLTHEDGTLIDSIVMKRKLAGLSLRSSRNVGQRTLAISTGCSQGYIVKHPTVQPFCEYLALALGSTGPLNVQLRYDVQRDMIHVFEIPTRFSGTTPIRADVGFNEVDILLRHLLLGERFRGGLSYRADVAVIRAFEHVIVPMDDILPEPVLDCCVLGAKS